MKDIDDPAACAKALKAIGYQNVRNDHLIPANVQNDLKALADAIVFLEERLNRHVSDSGLRALCDQAKLLPGLDAIVEDTSKESHWQDRKDLEASLFAARSDLLREGVISDQLAAEASNILAILDMARGRTPDQEWDFILQHSESIERLRHAIEKLAKARTVRS